MYQNELRTANDPEHIDTIIRRVLAQIKPKDFYRHELGLDLSRCRHVPLNVSPCPFCHSREGFFLNPATGAYSCFICGAAGGDIVDFVQERRELDTEEALWRLVLEWEVC